MQWKMFHGQFGCFGSFSQVLLLTLMKPVLCKIWEMKASGKTAAFNCGLSALIPFFSSLVSHFHSFFLFPRKRPPYVQPVNIRILGKGCCVTICGHLEYLWDLGSESTLKEMLTSRMWPSVLEHWTRWGACIRATCLSEECGASSHGR